MGIEQVIHILAIDDDPALHCLVDRALVRQGYAVTTATDGASGLEAIAAVPFDLIIVDYDMPGVSGLDVVRAVQGMSHQPPVVMLTGKGNERVAVEALKMGAADYLVKDVDLAFLELLPTVIGRVLARRRLEQERNELFAGIRESEERYRHLVDLIPDGIAIVVDGLLTLINPAGCRILGAVGPHELVGLPFCTVIGRIDPGTAVTEICEQALDNATTPHWHEFAWSRPSGERMYGELLAMRFSYLGTRGIEVIFRDITEKRLYNELLEHMATFDALTDLPNRALFFEKFQQILALSLRYGDVGALFFIDLDGFKSINDTNGHEVGDRVLQEVAARLRLCVRQVDVVARLGGDEFMVVLTKLTSAADAGAVGGKILDELCRPLRIDDLVTGVSASIGIALFPQDSADAAELLRAADHAMYRAKRSGGNRICFYGQEAHEGCS